MVEKPASTNDDDWIVSYLIGHAIARRDKKDFSEKSPWFDSRVFGDPLAKFRAFVQAVENRPEESGKVEIPTWVAETFAEIFKWFLDHVDGGGKRYDALLIALGVHGGQERGGRGSPIQLSKTKKANLGKAMLMAWVIHIGAVNGRSISASEAAVRIELLGENEYPGWNAGEKGYRRSNLMRAWKLYERQAREAVDVITSTSGFGQILGPEEWPHIAKVAASGDYG